MATSAAPAADAFEDLERAVRHLGEELAFFRRRALEAERRVRDLTTQVSAAEARAEQAASTSPGDSRASRERLATLEAENAELRDRLAEAAERTRALADRVRFVRQQQVADAAEEPA